MSDSRGNQPAQNNQAAEPPAPEHRAPELRQAAVRVVRRLRDAGHLAYFAGGCVRDELLGVVPKDYDVATDATPDRVQALFSPRTSAVGAAFGVVLVKDRACVTEVATFRADGPYSDKRRPDHIIFATAEQDAQRRDFTINAMFLDPLAEDDADRVIDYVGGRADAAARLLRAVGDPARRLTEDHLRALRAVRFAARYTLAIEEQTAAAIREHAAQLGGVSRERIGDEIRRILAARTRGRAVALLDQLALTKPATSGVLPHAGPDAAPVLSLLSEHASATLALAAWACAAHARLLPPTHADQIARGLRAALMLSNDESSSLRSILSTAHDLAHHANEDTAPHLAARKRIHAREHAPDALELLRALSIAGLTPGAWQHAITDRTALETDGVGLAPTALLDGDALVAAGYLPGPGFAQVLALVYDAQLEGRLRTTEQALHAAADNAARLGLRRR